MEQYEKYKTSGIEWIGEIPSHWQVKKLSHGFKKIGSGTTPTSGNTEYYLDGEFNWLQTGDLTNAVINTTSKKITKKALADFSTLRFYKPNSLVIAMYGATIGKTGILNIETTTNQACCVLSEPNSFESKYVFYWFNANKDIVISLSYGGGQPNISQEIIRAIRVPCPPKEEQATIAIFLDEKTAQIDTLITNKQNLIELLKEERTAIINEAVSGKGKNWERKKLKYVAKLRDELIDNSKFKIAVENIESSSGRLVNMQEEKNYEGQLSAFFKGDTIFNKLRPYLHKVYLAEKDGGLYGELLIIYSTGELTPEFLFFKLFSKNFIDVVDGSTQGTKMPRANWNDFISQLLISFPKDKIEQMAIVQHIQTEMQQVDRTISKIEQEIELMNEYRTALISEVVTGKMKITE
jgi:type I restriction enzyme, S subunit